MVAYAPNVPDAMIGTVQATPSVETFEELIGPPTSRVFCESAPASSQLVGRAAAFTVVALLVLLVLLLLLVPIVIFQRYNRRELEGGI